jgi:hypothetical protein
MITYAWNKTKIQSINLKIDYLDQSQIATNKLFKKTTSLSKLLEAQEYGIF